MTPRRVTRAVALIALWACGTTAATWVVNDRGDTGPLEVLTVQPAHATPTVPDPINPAARAAAQREQQATESHLRATAYWDAVRRSTTTTTTTTVTNPSQALVATAPRHYAPGVEQWRSLVAQYPWPVDTMLAIMRCESGGNPLAQNRSGASGLFQLLPGPPGWQDPATNIRYAYEVKYLGARNRGGSGLEPWSASGVCW